MLLSEIVRLLNEVHGADIPVKEGEQFIEQLQARLTKDDIAHYQSIVVALKETMRLMEEIDEVIEAHGGWPIE